MYPQMLHWLADPCFRGLHDAKDGDDDDITQPFLLRDPRRVCRRPSSAGGPMRSDSRLSRMLHALIHMELHEGAATSESLAQLLNTNPVVVRRTMAGLRDQGYVRSEKGHGGGWVLARDLRDITLLDIYRALDDPTLFAIRLAVDHPECLVEKAVNSTLSDALHEAEALLLGRFGEVTLADVARDFAQRSKAAE
jgi:Rrf2 family protein